MVRTQYNKRGVENVKSGNLGNHGKKFSRGHSFI
jgi:hypothetical protein